MASGYTYTFPALRGVQAGRQYFVAMCPLKLLPRIFLFDEPELPAQLRAQRVLNTSRIPEICRYILDNPRDYAFSAITASIDGGVTFHAHLMDGEEQDIGNLEVPMSARFIINDGQHRRAAIEAALEEQPELGDETIAVVFFLDAGLRRSQQLFADLNQHAARASKSLGILYDNRSPLSALARELAEHVPCFRGLTDFERTTISNRSTKLFTLSGIFQASVALLGKREGDAVTEEERTRANCFWCELSQIIPQWRLAAERQVRSYELRRDYVNVHTVLLHAIGVAGRRLVARHPNDWQRRLALLGRLDWSRANTDVWEGRAMLGGHMSKTRRSLQLTAAFLSEVLGVAAPDSNATVTPDGPRAVEDRANAKPVRRRRATKAND